MDLAGHIRTLCGGAGDHHDPKGGEERAGLSHLEEYPPDLLCHGPALRHSWDRNGPRIEGPPHRLARRGETGIRDLRARADRRHGDPVSLASAASAAAG